MKLFNVKDNNKTSRIVIKKTFVCCLTALVLGNLLLACKPNRTTDASDTRDIVDMIGRTVTIPKTLNKVWMDWGQGVTFMMPLGAIDKLVCVGTSYDHPVWSWAKTIMPPLESVIKDDAPTTNMEALLAYKPDVVFAIGNARPVEEYEKVGIPAVMLSFVDYDAYMQSLAIIGEVLGGEYATKATRFIDFFANNITLVTDRLKDVDESDKKSMYYADGYGDNALIAMGRGSFETAWITTAGGKLAMEESGRSIELTEEKLLQLNPDMIFIGSQLTPHIALQWLKESPTMRNLDAVKNNQLYRMPQGIFMWGKMGPEASMTMVWGAKLLYPNKFEDIDMVQMAKGFYRDFIGVDVSDDYIAMILKGKRPPDGE